MTGLKKIAVILLIVLVSAAGLKGQQQAYFVDGYHGGVYGHYPFWVTTFMLDHLEASPSWRIGLEIEPETWDTVKVKDPAGYARMKEWAKDSRLDFTNPTYAQPYLYNISGESIIRQFAYGMAKYHAHFPEINFTTYAVEEPCFTSSLPQILRQFGFQYAVLKTPNTCWGGYIRAHGGQFLNWEGPDGTAILTVPRYANEAFEKNSTWQTTAWANTVDYWKSCYEAGIMNPVGMCYQDAGWKNGPWMGTGEQVKNKVLYTTWTEYFRSVPAGRAVPSWKMGQEDILVNLMWGSQVLQRIAQQVRKAENSILQAEKIGAMAFMDHGFVPDHKRLDEAWRTLMMAQHHDSWIVPYNKLHQDQTWAQAIEKWTNNTLNIADQLIQQANASYASSTRSTNSELGYIRVYNTLARHRKEWVQVRLPADVDDVTVWTGKQQVLPVQCRQTDQGKVVEFEAEVNGFGYATYQLKPAQPIKPGQSKSRERRKIVRFDTEGNCILENELYKIVLDKKQGGTIKSLIAKYANHKEFAAQDGAYRMGEIAGHFYEQEKFYSSKESPVVFTIVQDDGLKTTVEVKGNINGHPFVQLLSLVAGQQRIDMNLTIDWKDNVGIGEYKQQKKWTDNRRAFTDDRYKLKVMFPSTLKQGKIAKNAPFDVTESSLEDTFFGQWDQIKNNVVLNWVDLYDENSQYGLAVLTDHTGSYVHGKAYPLSLTAQYSGLGLWGMDYKITEPLHMRYALIPHENNWNTARIADRSNAWNEPLLAFYHPHLELSDRQLITISDNNLEISALQLDHGQLSLRLFNTGNKQATSSVAINSPAASLQEVLLNGEQKGNIPLSRIDDKRKAFVVQLPKFGIRTFQINK
ncbi:glycosyl hydrolase [Sphingobacterium siyangense]|uniref:glycoside hydrolase family 38 N-terminal domain-containing protein n=1 Tax=Sphingobacterium siyangense TaxID=459529 RepID=UPI00200D4472|nr:glycoside hydrolase family 38 C-terminal domain-containing protein [Sphingobacterium siyangense]UQA77604.1 glycosyl hydrolase [Sphingobacterium siyangense]